MIGEKFPLNPPPAVPIAIIILLYRYGVRFRHYISTLKEARCIRVVSCVIRRAILQTLGLY
jgi:hypothetical protein